MSLNFAALAAAVLSVFAVVSGFNANSNANLAVYYGQNSRNIVGAQANLSAYCQGITLIVVLVDGRFNVGCMSYSRPM
jgi:hypothetical protein